MIELEANRVWTIFKSTKKGNQRKRNPKVPSNKIKSLRLFSNLVKFKA